MPIILIIDDSSELLELFASIFGSSGIECLVAKKKSHALAQLNTVLPDLIILDVMLEKEDGRHLCKELKSQQAYRHIPVILTSASPANLRDYRDYLADDILEKPFHLSILKEKIKAVANLKIAIRRNAPKAD